MLPRDYRECLSAGWHFLNHSIKLLPVDVGGRARCHSVVKPAGIVRYLADHLTVECSASRLYSYVCIRHFSLLYRLCYDGPFRMKSCPETFISTLSFYEHLSYLSMYWHRQYCELLIFLSLYCDKYGKEYVIFYCSFCTSENE